MIILMICALFSLSTQPLIFLIRFAVQIHVAYVLRHDISINFETQEANVHRLRICEFIEEDWHQQSQHRLGQDSQGFVVA